MTKRKDSTDITPDALMERLVENALDFLSRAIDEFQDAPKYSVIHFSTAVELFLKARLMAEHWSLVVANRQAAEWDKFKLGDFQSVTLAEALSKLEKVVRSPISKEAQTAFCNIANHRNRVIHFFHLTHTDTQTKPGEIVKEQLPAWFYLHRLLQHQWSDIFSPWLEEINAIEEKLRTYRGFLSLVFEEVKPKLEESRNTGASIENCDSCHFDSMVYSTELNTLYRAHCLVCLHSVQCVTIKCPSCSQTVRFEEEGCATCGHCGEALEPEHLADAMEDAGAAYIAAKDGGEDIRANCGNCDAYRTVACTPSNQWFAACCFTEPESIQPCEFCQGLNTRDMDMSYLTGCGICEGSIAFTK